MLPEHVPITGETTAFLNELTKFNMKTSTPCNISSEKIWTLNTWSQYCRRISRSVLYHTGRSMATEYGVITFIASIGSSFFVRSLERTVLAAVQQDAIIAVTKPITLRVTSALLATITPAQTRSSAPSCCHVYVFL